jgi:hypothetical protein
MKLELDGEIKKSIEEKYELSIQILKDSIAKQEENYLAQIKELKENNEKNSL